MSVIDEVLEEVADPSSGLLDALEAYRVATRRLEDAPPACAEGYDVPERERLVDEAAFAEEKARKLLADALGVTVMAEPTRPAVAASEQPWDWSKSGRAA